uniref:MotA/TolQ/ExbB proton channel domain-containing protein n=1 Tax=mine drainage metagenome TaxID=410659 RepID=E6PZA0_9ZZZZ
MAKLTLVFAALFIALGLVGFLGTGSQHPTALIPAALGLLLAIFGGLSFSPDPGRRKLFMHINVTLGLLGFLGTVMGLVQWFGMLAGRAVNNPPAAEAKAAMALLSLLYVVLCVRSFITARRSGVV